MMNRCLIFGMLLGISLFFSSCFQMIEDITVKEDGSGNVTLTANLSQSRTKLASILLLDSVNGHKVPNQQEIRRELSNMAKELSAIPGISQVKHEVDFNKYIITLRFAFADVKNLSAATDKVFKKMEINAGAHASYTYDPTKRVFARVYKHVPRASAEFNKLKAADREVFNGANFTTVYRFHAPVTKQSNPQAKIAASGQAVMLQGSILDLINGKIDISNQIQLTK